MYDLRTRHHRLKLELLWHPILTSTLTGKTPMTVLEPPADDLSPARRLADAADGLVELAERNTFTAEPAQLRALAPALVLVLREAAADPELLLYGSAHGMAGLVLDLADAVNAALEQVHVGELAWAS